MKLYRCHFCKTRIEWVRNDWHLLNPVVFGPEVAAHDSCYQQYAGLSAQTQLDIDRQLAQRKSATFAQLRMELAKPQPKCECGRFAPAAGKKCARCWRNDIPTDSQMDLMRQRLDFLKAIAGLWVEALQHGCATWQEVHEASDEIVRLTERIQVAEKQRAERR